MRLAGVLVLSMATGEVTAAAESSIETCSKSLRIAYAEVSVSDMFLPSELNEYCTVEILPAKKIRGGCGPSWQSRDQKKLRGAAALKKCGRFIQGLSVRDLLRNPREQRLPGNAAQRGSDFFLFVGRR